ncbi:MAG: TlpA disulfide reductase family protein [Micropepsaceae bacterium]
MGRLVGIIAITLSLAMADESAAQQPVVGAPAPPFSGVTLDGEKISFDAMRGNVVVLNFWATWCAPCRVELPLLESYLRAREQNGLRVVAVTVDADRVPSRAIRKVQDALTLPLLQKFEGEYAPIGRAVPTNYVIDRAGVIRYAAADAFDLDTLNEILVPLLNEAPPLLGGSGAVPNAEPTDED